MGGAIAPFIVLPIYFRWGWRPAVIIPGLLGFLWILPWRKVYQPPQAHSLISDEEHLTQLARPAQVATDPGDHHRANLYRSRLVLCDRLVPHLSGRQGPRFERRIHRRVGTVPRRRLGQFLRRSRHSLTPPSAPSRTCCPRICTRAEPSPASADSAAPDRGLARSSPSNSSAAILRAQGRALTTPQNPGREKRRRSGACEGSMPAPWS